MRENFAVGIRVKRFNQGVREVEREKGRENLKGFHKKGELALPS